MAASPSIRVLVVDDSATTRAMILQSLSADPGIEVVAQARNAMEAREAIKALDPDVMTLDIEMPHMNGLDFLEKVMTLRPFPVVMVSGFTDRGASATIRAMELGAVDCIAKPSPRFPRSFDELPEKVRAAARARVSHNRAARAPQASAAPAYRPGQTIVAIGASTGGVDAIIEIVSRFPENCPPTLVTIHMPSPFTTQFAKRLDRLSAARVEEATQGAPLRQGRVYVAPGGGPHLKVSKGKTPQCRLHGDELVNGHLPSVDVLFHSVAERGPEAVGVILTGMGQDGARGLLAMRKAGAATIGQDASTCVVYGMPRISYEIGAVETQLPVERIADEILSLTAATTKAH